MTVLVGRSTGGTTADFVGSGNSAAVDFVAAGSGVVAVLGFHPKSANAGLTSFTLAIYADNGAGAPGARLGITAAVTVGITSGAIITAPLLVPVTVVGGTTYWLAWDSAGEQFDFQGENSGQYIEKSAGTLPDPWDNTGISTTTGHEPIIWGEDASAAPVFADPLWNELGPSADFGPDPFHAPVFAPADVVATTPVDGDALDLVWDLRAQADGIALDLVWDLRAEANGVPLDLLWDLRSEANGIALDLLWDLRAQADGVSLDLLWDVIAQVNGISLDLLWDVRAEANGVPLDLLWDLYAQVDGVSLDAVWDLRAAVDAGALDLIWDLASASTPVNGAALSLLWDLVAQVNGPPARLVWDLASETVTPPPSQGGGGGYVPPMRVEVDARPLRLRWGVSDRPLPSPLSDAATVPPAKPKRAVPIPPPPPRRPRAMSGAPLALRWNVAGELAAAPLVLRWRLAAQIEGARVVLQWASSEDAHELARIRGAREEDIAELKRVTAQLEEALDLLEQHAERLDGVRATNRELEQTKAALERDVAGLRDDVDALSALVLSGG